MKCLDIIENFGFQIYVFIIMQNFIVFKHSLLCRYFTSQKNLKTETYYDILKVNQQSDSKDIRSAYVELTKKFHPDVTGGASNSQFVKISEAYNVLSKPQTRAAYDQQLLARRPRTTKSSAYNYDGRHTTETHKPWEVKPNYDPNPGPYYGIKGIRRVSNSKVALVLFGVGVLFSIIGFSSVNRSFTLDNTLQDKKSSEASTHHASIRADAQKYGNEEQLRRMTHRMLNRENGAAKNLQETSNTK